MSDLIDREDVIAVLCFCEETKTMLCGDLRKILEKINEIPTAETERTANVYKKQAPDRLYYFYCGACGEMIDCSFYDDYKSIKSYCGYCGARLEWEGSN